MMCVSLARGRPNSGAGACWRDGAGNAAFISAAGTAGSLLPVGCGLWRDCSFWARDVVVDSCDRSFYVVNACWQLNAAVCIDIFTRGCSTSVRAPARSAFEPGGSAPAPRWHLLHSTAWLAFVFVVLGLAPHPWCTDCPALNRTLLPILGLLSPFLKKKCF